MYIRNWIRWTGRHFPCFLPGRLRKNGTITYLSYSFTNMNVINHVSCSVQAPRSLVPRGSDLVFFYITHNVIRYAYELETLTFVESDRKSRAVFFNLNLSEDAMECIIVLSDWHSSFNCLLPPVFFTDGDEEIAAAVWSLPYSSSVKHLLSKLHVFDQNIKTQYNPSSVWWKRNE